MPTVNESFTYRDNCNKTGVAWCTANSQPPQNLTAYPAQNLTDSFACMCEKCGSSLEPIFQPAGRAVCTMVGFPLPCQDEMDACKEANPGSVTSTGSYAGLDMVYPAIMDGSASADPCHPEAALFGYKVGWNLTVSAPASSSDALPSDHELCFFAAAQEDCTEGALPTGGPTALALAQCVAASRASAFDADMNCLDIGGAACGEPYECTYVAPTSATQQSGSTAAAVAASTLAALAAANL